MAAITKRDSPIASTASILLPSEDRLFELTFAPRCVAYFCRSESSVYEEKTYKAKSWHEDLLTTVRSVERSNLFGKVDVEEYDKIDRARINSAGDLVIAVHGTELGHDKGGWYLYTRRDPAGTYLPFDESIKPQSRRVDAWLSALEALVRENM